MARLEHHVFICVNERSSDDPRGCCASRGGSEIRGLFSDELKARGLKSKIRANKAGCLDLCSHGPVVVVYPSGIWYSPQSGDDVRMIVEDHLIGGKPVTDLQIPGT